MRFPVNLRMPDGRALALGTFDAADERAAIKQAAKASANSLRRITSAGHKLEAGTVAMTLEQLRGRA
jgi:hypothetical protein